MSMSPSMLLNLQDEAVAVGNGSSVLVYGASVAVVQVTGITTATITWEGTVDETNWVSLVAKNVASGAEASTATADGIYAVPVTGIVLLRARISAWTSGTIIANAIATDKPTSFVNTTVAAVIGVVDTELPTAAALNGTWAKTTVAPIVGAALLLNDGTNLIQAVGGAGAVSSAVPRTTLASDDPAVTALQIMDDWDESDRAKVNPIAGQAGVAGGAGAAGATVQRVVLATDTTVPNVTGNVAHDAADSGNPVKIGGRAIAAEITPATAADRTDFVADLTGKQIVLPYANPENFVSGCISSAMTGTTSTSLIAAPAAGLRNYITQITVSNSHATVGTDIIIQDGSGGTTLYVIPAAAVFGGASITFPVPLRQPTTATAIFCANVTTGSNTKVSASGYKGA